MSGKWKKANTIVITIGIISAIFAAANVRYALREANYAAQIANTMAYLAGFIQFGLIYGIFRFIHWLALKIKNKD